MCVTHLPSPSVAVAVAVAVESSTYSEVISSRPKAQINLFIAFQYRILARIAPDTSPPDQAWSGSSRPLNKSTNIRKRHVRCVPTSSTLCRNAETPTTRRPLGLPRWLKRYSQRMHVRLPQNTYPEVRSHEHHTRRPRAVERPPQQIPHPQCRLAEDGQIHHDSW